MSTTHTRCSTGSKPQHTTDTNPPPYIPSWHFLRRPAAFLEHTHARHDTHARKHALYLLDTGCVCVCLRVVWCAVSADKRFSHDDDDDDATRRIYSAKTIGLLAHSRSLAIIYATEESTTRRQASRIATEATRSASVQRVL